MGAVGWSSAGCRSADHSSCRHCALSDGPVLEYAVAFDTGGVVCHIERRTKEVHPCASMVGFLRGDPSFDGRIRPFFHRRASLDGTRAVTAKAAICARGSLTAVRIVPGPQRRVSAGSGESFLFLPAALGMV